MRKRNIEARVGIESTMIQGQLALRDLAFPRSIKTAHQPNTRTKLEQFRLTVSTCQPFLWMPDTNWGSRFSPILLLALHYSIFR
jgi:hypothetical protein